MRRSPSPPTSASTLSSSLGGCSTENTGGMAAPATAASDSASRKDEWVSELLPLQSELEVVTGGGNRCGLEDWDTMMSESPGQEHSLLRWIAGDVDESSFGLKQLLQSGHNNPLDFDGNAGLGIVDQAPAFDSIGTVGNRNLAFPASGFASVTPNSSSGLPNFKVSSVGLSSINCNNFPPGLMYHQLDEKPQIQQNPNFCMLSEQPQAKRHNTGDSQIQKVLFSDPGSEFLLRKHQHQQLSFPPGLQFLPPQKPLLVDKQKVMGPGEDQQQQHALLDQLYKAAELVGTENFSHAQAILARLNHQLSPVGKPLHRAAFYFKEALQLLLATTNHPPPRTPAPFDVIFKMGAYKVFSEVSPIIQFVNFTCNQALLEALEDANRIHIIDFDIGFGAQWASFMQELPVRNRGAPSLKITAFASPSTHHPIELLLMRENLNQFATEIGLDFELEVVNLDSLAQSSYSLPMHLSSENKSVAVNVPAWTSSDQPSALPCLLRFVKQLSPKIVVSLDRGCDRNDLPFPQHLLHALQSYIHLLESLEAVNVNSDALNKIERFLLQPRIESTVLGRLRAPEKMPVWKTLFASAGFSPITFSNFTETQAECVVRRTSARGFHVDKVQASLVLCWQRRELISASAWRC